MRFVNREDVIFPRYTKSNQIIIVLMMATSIANYRCDISNIEILVLNGLKLPENYFSCSVSISWSLLFWDALILVSCNTKLVKISRG